MRFWINWRKSSILIFLSFCPDEILNIFSFCPVPYFVLFRNILFTTTVLKIQIYHDSFSITYLWPVFITFSLQILSPKCRKWHHLRGDEIQNFPEGHTPRHLLRPLSTSCTRSKPASKIAIIQYIELSCEYSQACCGVVSTRSG